MHQIRFKVSLIIACKFYSRIPKSQNHNMARIDNASTIIFEFSVYFTTDQSYWLTEYNNLSESTAYNAKHQRIIRKYCV